MIKIIQLRFPDSSPILNNNGNNCGFQYDYISSSLSIRLKIVKLLVRELLLYYYQRGTELSEFFTKTKSEKKCGSFRPIFARDFCGNIYQNQPLFVEMIKNVNF